MLNTIDKITNFFIIEIIILYNLFNEFVNVKAQNLKNQ